MYVLHSLHGHLSGSHFLISFLNKYSDLDVIYYLQYFVVSTTNNNPIIHFCEGIMEILRGRYVDEAGIFP